MARLLIGTCSWKYPSWEGLVYSKASGINYLKEYSRAYGTVEIDQWFWSLPGMDSVSLPDPATVSEYSSSVPEDFRFTIKVPNSITLTHFYKKKGEGDLMLNPHFLSSQLFLEFLSRLKPMKEKVGILMFQFEYLNRQKIPSQTTFLAKLADFFSVAPEGYQYAVESRNPNHLKEKHFEFLRRYKLAQVFIQGYYMPQITEIYDKFQKLIRGTAVVRLHGYDRESMEKVTGEKWNRIVSPKDHELPGIVGMVKALLERNVNVYLNVNNHYEGSAPLTIEKIKAMGLMGELNPGFPEDRQ